MPADFPETFARVGWEAIEDETRARKDTIRRWVIDHGEEALIEKRRAYLAERYAARGHRVPGRKAVRKLGISARYVMGPTAGTLASQPVIRATAADLSAALAERAPGDME